MRKETVATQVRKETKVTQDPLDPPDHQADLALWDPKEKPLLGPQVIQVPRADQVSLGLADQGDQGPLVHLDLLGLLRAMAQLLAFLVLLDLQAFQGPLAMEQP